MIEISFVFIGVEVFVSFVVLAILHATGNLSDLTGMVYIIISVILFILAAIRISKMPTANDGNEKTSITILTGIVMAVIVFATIAVLPWMFGGVLF